VRSLDESLRVKLFPALALECCSGVYSGVTVVLHLCYSCVTVVLKWCDNGVTW
jgi:hypothetical protein